MPLKAASRTLKNLLLAIGLSGSCLPLSAATLFFDDFSGSSINESVWRLPTGDGTFFGQTQIKPPEYFGQNLRPTVSGGTATLTLDTYNESGAGTFWGHEIQTLQTFTPGTNGISIESRIRFNGTPPGGLVGGFFTWGYDGSIRDEIDVELLSNDLAGDRFFTNLYNNDTFSDPGVTAFANVPGYDMTDWNIYEIRWLPDRVQWYLNGIQVREQVEVVDGHPSEVRLNIWTPNSGFSQAYNAGLAPAFSSATNQTYSLEIDYVSVSAVPLPPALWLFGGAIGILSWIGKKRKAN